MSRYAGEADPAPRELYSAPQMECELCTWSPAHDGYGGRHWRLKYVNRMCGLHSYLLRRSL